ncbi:MAG: sigma 54-dependent Fis family transcriptional regulator [Deltaproteobacteria bacterium]|nr:sigma 54-dependent Fis family transcriptional regulator [Deltaproteobacteria bacterium]
MSDEFEEDVTTRVPKQKRGMAISSAELLVIAGPERGQRAPFHAGSAKIGTAMGMTLRLTDPTVSRVHCELEMRGSRILVRDVGSTNGTIVEGVRVLEAEVEAGSVLKLGQSAVRIELSESPAFVPMSEASELGELKGTSPEMRQVYAILERTAPTDSTVLIQGETGTGKDVAARSLHQASKRRAGPFVPIDCGAIPENLIESELFGHVRGAFSGASADRVGVFEEADGGTLFLDEIGEMPVSVQPKLLRALETKSVRPVGSNSARPIDARIIAATNRSLAECVNDGTFREDLYYRLAVIEVTLPPLRHRRADIAMLARHFHRKLDPDGKELPEAFVELLTRRSWPGNVRELRNYIERCWSLGTIEGHARVSMPPPEVASLIPLHLPLKDARQAWLDQFETVYVEAMLAATGGNLTKAADRAGVSRRFLQRLLARRRGGEG